MLAPALNLGELGDKLAAGDESGDGLPLGVKPESAGSCRSPCRVVPSCTTEAAISL